MHATFWIPKSDSFGFLLALIVKIWKQVVNSELWEGDNQLMKTVYT